MKKFLLVIAGISLLVLLADNSGIVQTEQGVCFNKSRFHTVVAPVDSKVVEDDKQFCVLR